MTTGICSTDLLHPHQYTANDCTFILCPKSFGIFSSNFFFTRNIIYIFYSRDPEGFLDWHLYINNFVMNQVDRGEEWTPVLMLEDNKQPIVSLLVVSHGITYLFTNHLSGLGVIFPFSLPTHRSALIPSHSTGAYREKTGNEGEWASWLVNWNWNLDSSPNKRRHGIQDTVDRLQPHTVFMCY